MKIIITERQLRKIILESESPCPNGEKEDKLITLEDIEDGKTLELGYCNGSSNSAIVFVQKKLKSAGNLKWDGKMGYFGEKTLEALCDFLGYEECEKTIKVGKNAIKKLKEEKEDKTPESLFNKLTKSEKIIVCTLIGEAGGEFDYQKGMQAVANVLRNRAESNHLSKGTTVTSQALANKQFSMWDKYNSGKETLEDVYKKYINHDKMEVAISIAKSIDSIKDITKGANYYYANYVTPDWTKESDTTTWKKTVTIGNHIFGNVVKKKNK